MSKPKAVGKFRIWKPENLIGVALIAAGVAMVGACMPGRFAVAEVASTLILAGLTMAAGGLLIWRAVE